tara:strand:- start:215 stop:475 length:261 start_codon:yes stop_codon:yes gene_type:complete
MSKTYTPREVASLVVGAWIEGIHTYCNEIDTGDILEMVKDVCRDYNLGMEVVKEIFEEYEDLFIYDIEKDEIVNPDEEDEEPTQEY